MTICTGGRELDGRADTTESGYVLIGVVFFVALVLLSLAIAAPKVAAAIQRDRELELVHRGEQYKRAIKLYYKKFGAYPSTMEQLEKTNNIRFLRKRYVDPLTGKDDWKLIHIGEAHLHPLGFFGKPLSVTTPIGGATNLGGGLGSSTTLGQGSQTGTSFGTSASGTSGTSFGSSAGASNTNTGAQSGSSGGLYAGVDNSGTSSPGSGSGSSGTSSTGFGANTSQTLGGAPIVGVVIASEKSSIVEYKLQKTYKDWEFVYDPVEEQAAAAGSLIGGGTTNLNGSSGTSSGIGGTGIGSGTGSGTLGGGLGGGSSTGGFGTQGGSGGSGTGGTGAGSGSGTTPPQ